MRFQPNATSALTSIFVSQLSAVQRALRVTLLFGAGLVLLSGSAHAQDREPLHKVAPTYPAVAKQMHISGNVKVVATVDATGNVTKAESDSKLMLLVPAAIDAVKHWKFKPGEGIATVTVLISFDPGA